MALISFLMDGAKKWSRRCETIGIARSAVDIAVEHSADTRVPPSAVCAGVEEAVDCNLPGVPADSGHENSADTQ
jgi:hypothetical protein